MSIDKNILKSVLEDITKMTVTTSITTDCGAEFDPNTCEANECEYFFECMHQKEQYDKTMILLQKIKRL